MISVVVIKQNDFVFDRNKYYCNINQLSLDISEFVSLRDTDDLMETIVQEIGLTQDLIGASPICFETDKNIYQVCYAGTQQDNVVQQEVGQLNKIANYLVNDNISGNCVFINSLITNNGTCSSASSTIDTLIQILYSKFFHIGIFIPNNDSESIREFVYGDHPLEYYQISEYDENKYKIEEFEFISLGLCAIIDLIPDNKQVNKRASRIIGNKLLYGNVLLILKASDAYQDLNKTLYTQINILSYGSLEDRILTEEEKKDVGKINDLQIINNKYCILNMRNGLKCCYKNCNKINEVQLCVCTGCYRVRYHDRNCQTNDWSIHKNDCFYNK